MRQILTFLPFLLTGAVTAFGAVDQGLLSLAPSEVQMIASVDVSSAGNSEFGQYLLKNLDSNEKGLQDFIQQTGFDPRRDLQTLLLISSNPSAGHKAAKTIVLARGSFDLARVKSTLLNMGSHTQLFQGTNLFINKQNENALAFPETGVAIFGDVDSVKEAISRRSNPVSLDPKLGETIQAVGAKNDIWFASPSASHLLAGMGPQVKGAQALQSILEASGGIRFGTLVKVSAEAIARSPQDADSLASVIRFGANMLQSQSQQDPRAALLASALNAMDLQVTGSSVHLALSMSEKTLEQIAQAEQRHPGNH